jgi:hypothetical protein
MCVLGILALLGSERALFAQAAPAEGLSVQVIGLRVAAESELDVMNMGVLGGLAKGTSLALLVQSKGKQIVKFDAEGSALRVLQDDKGTDLRGLTPKASGFPMGSFAQGSSGFQVPTFGFMQMSKDGKAGLLEVNGGALPSKDSARVKAEGTLKLSLGSEKKTERQQNVTLKEGTKITVGPVPFTIVKVESGTGAAGAKPGPKFTITMPPEMGLAPGKAAGGALPGGMPFDMNAMAKAFGMGEAAMTVTLRANDDISGIAAISFYDKAGKKVESNVMSSSSMSGMGKTIVDQQIGLSEKLDAADVVVEFWKDLEVKEVPFSVSAGLSLQ